MKKSVWVTALDKDEALAKEQMDTLSKYGLAVSGHFWIDDLKKAAWLGPVETLMAPETALWVISGKPETFADPTVRIGLSLLSLKIQAAKGHGFNIMVRPTGGVLEQELPTPLAGATILKESDNLGVKAAAAVNIPAKPLWGEYRLSIIAMPSVGQWFEIGPREGEWAGALFGISGKAEIDAHGVGDAGAPPERCVLNYPMQNAKLELDGTEYTAWAVKNPLDAGSSYYVRVKGAPEALVFGEMGEGDMPELYTIKLA
ncbi:MAG: hypothetical protein ACNI3A_11215 [Desulfovibrio sp.]|uniref:hypothetical protein n=1 Tax=Desulfovibrio sp. 7SRBS1 TaxID=3378064 RepID=UPI003B3FF7DE